ncbi:MAG TPA: S9 family peptidase, partial [Anaerolineae bacterium]|nr:S9 family peptidase [Anaerolineae bacterium]
MMAMDLETLLRVPHVEPDTGFDVSPDGEQVAFSWNRTGRWEVYVAPLDGRAELQQQKTTGPGAKFAPRWSPDGCRLAYALDLDGGEAYDLWVCDLTTGQHLNLTPDTPDALQPNFDWSPDGRQVAILSDRAGRFDTYVLPATGGQAQPVLSTPYPDWEVRWSPDARWLAVVTEAQGQDRWTFIVPLAGGEPRLVGDESGPLCAQGSRWSPDGCRLAFASDRHGRFDIGLYELASGEITWLTEGGADHEQPAWSPDGRRLAYTVGHGPLNEVAVRDLATGRTATYRVAAGVHYRPRFTLDGVHLLFAFDNPARPTDLWRLSLADGSLHQLTHSLPPDLCDALFVLPEQVRYPSLDGTPVPALLYRPARTDGPPPAVVYIHGGPNWLTQVTWDPLIQHMVGRGWAVLAPNYRGSTGYGRAWQYASRFDLGGCDTEDVVAGADYLVREGLADPARIAVTGRSWGGYLTMTALTGYPDRWAVGSAVVPFLNWFTAHANSRADLQHWDRENFGDPEQDRDLYRERSPFFFLERIAAPVQMIGGAHDVRCPASESLQACARLRELGKEYDLVLYPDEGH